jgi:hypothetical protein
MLPILKHLPDLRGYKVPIRNPADVTPRAFSKNVVQLLSPMVWLDSTLCSAGADERMLLVHPGRRDASY